MVVKPQQIASSENNTSGFARRHAVPKLYAAESCRDPIIHLNLDCLGENSRISSDGYRKPSDFLSLC